MNFSTRDMVMVAFFSALMAVGAFISKVWPPDIIPFSLLPLLSLLAGIIIGPKLGALSIVVYILVGLTGIPVFASAPYGGITYIFKPTFGFLIGFAAAAYIAGMIVHKKKEPGWGLFLAASLAGILIVYLVGLPWMYLIYNYYLGKAISFSYILVIMKIYMLLDLVKAVLATVVGKTVYERVVFNLKAKHG